MAGLLDIAPASKQVMIPTSEGEAAVDVRGLSIADIRDLIARFPDIVGMLDKGLSVATVLKAGPDVIAAAIAAACGNPGSDQAEAYVRNSMGAAVQAEILTHMLRLTMPRGPGPFVDLLKAAGVDVGNLSAASSPTPPASSSSKPSDPSKKSSD